MRKFTLAAAAAFALSATAAHATATFDPATGEGRVYQSDIMTAFGVDQTGFDAINHFYGFSFAYDVSELYYVTCEWDQQFGSRVIHRRSGYVVKVTNRDYIDALLDGSPGNAYYDLLGYDFSDPLPDTRPKPGDQCGPSGRGGGAALVTSVTDTGTSSAELVAIRNDTGESHVVPFTTPG